MTLAGKGFFIWKLKNCEGGDPNAITAVAQKAGLSYVLIKVADRDNIYNYDYERRLDLVPPVARALQAAGIQVWGWQYIYGDDPLGEARKAVQRIRQLNLDGFVVNAERQFKEAGKDVVARRYMKELTSTVPETPIALSTYRFPSYHPQFPYKDFLAFSDFAMPQVYWMGATNPDVQLTKSLREYQRINSSVPIIPTGYAFSEHGYSPKPNEVELFMRTAKTLNLKSVNFWEWSSARNQLPEIWKTISDFSWSGVPREKDIIEKYIEALNSRDPLNVTKLYDLAGVHVDAKRMIQGPEAIKEWYSAYLNKILPSARFSLTGVSGQGSSRQFTWIAESPVGKVLNGNDTFGLKDGRIAYHYTFFTVQP